MKEPALGSGRNRFPQNSRRNSFFPSPLENDFPQTCPPACRGDGVDYSRHLHRHLVDVYYDRLLDFQVGKRMRMIYSHHVFGFTC